ncbi:MAG TPA: chemotaxis protein CheC [Thermoflexia bacterium]|jgi:chemotaxis protein CheC|nr:chemotaxis protein CheC [Thermoflexia bacterium]
MESTEQQRDALSDLINVALARTAETLSDLSNRRILIERPEVVICSVDEAQERLQNRISEPLIAVHQSFSGALTGTAILALDREEARTLVNLLVGEETSTPDLDISAREVVVEVGNILLSACTRVFGSLLQVRLFSSMPRFRLEDPATMLNTPTAQDEQYAIIAYTTFRVQEEAVPGIILIILGAHPIGRLFKAIEEQ